MLMLLALLISGAFAAERVVLLETQVPYTMDYTQSGAKFFMDTNTGMGYADVYVDEYRRDVYPYPGGYPGGVRCDRWGCYPTPVPTPQVFRILSKRVEVPNLNLVDKEMIYNGVNGEVNCGKLGLSRVLRRPTLYLSGACELKTYITNRDRLTLELIIK